MSAKDSQELNKLFSGNRSRLLRMVRLRMDSRLNGRVDESDVIQEAYAEAANRYEDFCSSQDCSPFVWLRFLTLQKLAQIHRHHIKVQARSVNREVDPGKFNSPPATSAVMAIELLGNGSTPLQAALRAELKQRIAGALDSLKESDREILAMRHFEQLTNQETAEALEISSESAYKRYVRALVRLKSELGDMPSTLSILP